MARSTRGRERGFGGEAMRRLRQGLWLLLLMGTAAAWGQDLVPEAADLARRGTALETSGELAGAEDSYRQALSLYERKLGQDHAIVAAGLEALGRVQFKQKRFGEAEPLLRRSL